MPSPELSDGVLPTGVFDITVLESGVSYAANNFSADVDSVVVRRKSSLATPSAQKIIEAFVDGTCDLQLATPGTAKPKVNMAFVADEDGDGTAEPFIITKIGKTFEQEGETKLKVSVSRAVAPVIYGGTGKTTAELYAGITYASSGPITTLGLDAYLPPGWTLKASSWAFSGLPAGLTGSASNGDITGTPTTPGVNYVKVTVQAERSIIRNGALVTETVTGIREFAITIS
jgi:hypothetical protein